MRFHPIFQTWRAHLGVDYAATQGTPVRCVGAGVVESAGSMGGYGNAIVIKHSNGHSTVYAHLSKMVVRRGQTVSQGQSIGLVGATGWATGPHLHFEFRFMGEPIDPTRIVNLDTKDLIADTISIDQGWFRHLTNPGPPKTTSFSGYHTIRKGDTLSGISKKYHVSVSRICKMNRITPTTTLKLGRKLKLV